MNRRTYDPDFKKHLSRSGEHNMIVFTDASKFIKESYTTGSIVYRLFSPTDEDKTLKIKNFLLESTSKITKAEEEMIVKSLNIFKNSYHGFDNIIIFSDCAAALQKVRSNEEFIKLKAYYNKKDIRILLKKVKSHNDNHMNNLADTAAKNSNYRVLNNQSKKKIPGIIYS